MDYRNELEKYYKYLGDDRPVHKMITNHLLCFADWLNNASQQPDTPDGESILSTENFSFPCCGGIDAHRVNCRRR